MTNRFRLSLAALGSASALLLAAPAGPAGAQEGSGEITLEAVHPAGSSLHFIVRVTDDGDAANDASVTAAAVSLSGESLDPVDLTRDDDDGHYSGPVEFPSAGLWTVRFTSTNPDATLEQTQEVDVSAGTVPDGGSGATVEETDPDGDFAAEDDGTGDSAQAEGDEEEEGIPIWLVILAAVVVIGGVVAALALRSRGPGSPGDGGDEAEPEPATGPPGGGTP